MKGTSPDTRRDWIRIRNGERNALRSNILDGNLTAFPARLTRREGCVREVKSADLQGRLPSLPAVVPVVVSILSISSAVSITLDRRKQKSVHVFRLELPNYFTLSAVEGESSITFFVYIFTVIFNCFAFTQLPF